LVENTDNDHDISELFTKLHGSYYDVDFTKI